VSKFKKLLSKAAKEIREGRANIVAENTKFAQEDIVRGIESEKRDLDARLMELTDVNRDSELSLRVTKKDFNAKQWCHDVQELKLAIIEKRIELEVAKETLEEWFGEDKSE